MVKTLHPNNICYSKEHAKPQVTPSGGPTQRGQTVWAVPGRTVNHFGCRLLCPSLSRGRRMACVSSNRRPNDSIRIQVQQHHRSRLRRQLLISLLGGRRTLQQTWPPTTNLLLPMRPLKNIQSLFLSKLISHLPSSSQIQNTLCAKAVKERNQSWSRDLIQQRKAGFHSNFINS